MPRKQMSAPHVSTMMQELSLAAIMQVITQERVRVRRWRRRGLRRGATGCFRPRWCCTWW